MSFSTLLRQSIVQNYGLKVFAAIPIGTAAMSTTMRLATDKGNLFLKCYKHIDASGHPLPPYFPHVAFGHAVQESLRRSNLPLPRLLPNRAGRTYTSSDAQIYAISEFVEGYDYEAVEPGVALQSAGELLGGLHQRLRGFECPIACPWTSMKEVIFTELTTRLERTRSVISKNEAHPVSQKQINQWRQELDGLTAGLAVENESNWIIHGDYRAQNLKFDYGGRVTAILDLDSVRPASRLFDLAYALVFFAAVYQNIPLTPLQKSDFLSAYETVCPLSEFDRKSLSAHLKLAFLRGMMLWLQLLDFGGMREKARPWIQGYLDNAETITEF